MAAAFISAGFRFDPTDADLVLGFLLPCLCGRAPGANGILLIRDADPFAISPDALLHGRRARPDGDAALFLVLSPKHPLVVGDTGAWRRQRVTKGAAVSEDGEAVVWRRELFAYDADGETSGWVMGRFRVLGAKKGQELVLCRVKKAE